MNATSTLHFPGSTAVSDLAVYDWEAPDGLNGGSPDLDAVMTFPRSTLADPAAYRGAGELPSGDEATQALAARRPSDLALEGYAELVADASVVLASEPSGPRLFGRLQVWHQPD